MEFDAIAQEIIQLQNEDLALRDNLVKTGQLDDGYNTDMQVLHNSNAFRLNQIIDAIGYPTISKVGVEANEAAWLVIQHAIGQPDFMKKCAQLLEHAVSQEEASPNALAYLTDRIAVLEGKPQLYGTQFDWDVHGALSPNPVDDLDKVNERRKSLGLNTLDEQTIIVRQRAAAENASPPMDWHKRKTMLEGWKRKVGWL